jgi:hypothetical protein
VEGRRKGETEGYIPQRSSLCVLEWMDELTSRKVGEEGGMVGSLSLSAAR